MGLSYSQENPTCKQPPSVLQLAEAADQTARTEPEEAPRMGLRLLRLDQCPHTDRGDAHSGRRKRESRRVEVSAGRRGPLSSKGPETDEGGCSLPPVLGRAERHLRSSRRPLHFAELGEELQRILPAYGVSDARASMAIARRGFSSSRRGYIPRGTESVSAPRHGTSVRAGGCTTCPGLARS